MNCRDCGFPMTGIICHQKHERKRSSIKTPPIGRNGLKRVRIKPESKKQAALNRRYGKLAREFKLKNPVCSIKANGCTGSTTDVHHKAGRGIRLLWVRYWLPVCRRCHQIVEQNDEQAWEKGWSIRPSQWKHLKE